MPISMAPPPDLQVTSVVAQGPDPIQLDHVLTGQTFTVTYTVTNTGAGAVPDRQAKWDDYIYISRDQFLSDADIYLGSEEHNGGLAAGASYQNSLSFKAPKNLTGPWYIFVLTDPPTSTSPATGVVFEASETNNATSTATPLLIDQPPPSDLVVDSITIPNAAMSGGHRPAELDGRQCRRQRGERNVARCCLPVQRQHLGHRRQTHRLL
ncbi:MAG: CARDB domain-containing protein [Bradyrhizobium sp.]